MNFLKKIIRLGTADGTKDAVLASYQRHRTLAERGEIPLAAEMTPHIAGLFGALANRRRMLGNKRHEHLILAELVPFLLMPEPESQKVLAEYIAFQEHDARSEEESLRAKINESLRTLPNAKEDWRAAATIAINDPSILWTSFLDPDVKTIFETEQRKISRSK
jgi:hypothetical protein